MEVPDSGRMCCIRVQQGTQGLDLPIRSAMERSCPSKIRKGDNGYGVRRDSGDGYSVASRDFETSLQSTTLRSHRHPASLEIGDLNLANVSAGCVLLQKPMDVACWLENRVESVRSEQRPTSEQTEKSCERTVARVRAVKRLM